MFSGKTEELIRRLKRAKFARQKVEIFKPALDTRYSDVEVVSHDSNHITSTPIESSTSILLLANDVDVVGIDEAQFFDSELVEVCNELARRGVRVIIAGLDMDFRCQPFGPMPALMAVADSVTKVHAICVKCGVKAGEGAAFCANCGQAVAPNADVCMNCGVALKKAAGDLNGQDKMVMILICLFLGGFGIHNFMMGETKKGIVKIVASFLCGIGGILALIDLIKIAMGNYVVDPEKMF
jgi:thymidine kinase